MLKTMKNIMVCSLILKISMSCCSNNRGDENSQNNAVWTESIFLRGFQPSTGEALSTKHIKDYAKILRINNIKYVFMFAGPFGIDGHLPDYPFALRSRNTVDMLKELCPGLIILPWIGGIQNKTVFLDDSKWRENALTDTKRLVDALCVDGVHVDFEYIMNQEKFLTRDLQPEKVSGQRDYGRNVNLFHKELRRRLPTQFISSVVTSTSRTSRPWKRKTSLEELVILCTFVDQINFLFYDTSISDQGKFYQGCEELVRDINTLKKNNTNIQCLISIGTFLNSPELRHYRNLGIENVPNTLRTIKLAANNVSPERPLVDGISIFCNWETDNLEWAQFRDGWVEH